MCKGDRLCPLALTFSAMLLELRAVRPRQNMQSRFWLAVSSFPVYLGHRGFRYSQFRKLIMAAIRAFGCINCGLQGGCQPFPFQSYMDLNALRNEGLLVCAYNTGGLTAIWQHDKGESPVTAAILISISCTTLPCSLPVAAVALKTCSRQEFPSLCLSFRWVLRGGR